MEECTQDLAILPHLNVAIGSVLQVGEVLPVSDVEQEGCALFQHL